MSDRLPSENTYLCSSEGVFSLPITVALRVKINFKQISTELWKSASFSVTVWLQRSPFPILVHRGLTNQVHPLTLWQSWDNWALQRVWLRSSESDCTQLCEGIKCMSYLISERCRCLMKYLGQISQSARNKELGWHTWKISRTRRGRAYTSSNAATRTAHALTYTSTRLRGGAVHLDVINQWDWIAGVWLGLELWRKGPFWGWTDPNRLWQGSY